MSIRRRASLAGLEVPTGYHTVTGDSFRHRMSLASLGTRKYGRSGAFESYSDCGEMEGKYGSGNVIVRHIPIVIEEDESEQNNEDDGQKDKTSNVINYRDSFFHLPSISSRSLRSSSLADDHSSLSSQSSDNSIESSRRKNKVEEEVKAWMKSSGEDRSSSMGSVGNSWESDIRRKPSSDIQQNKELNNKERQVRKTTLPRIQYLVCSETVGMKNCPVYGQENFSSLGPSSGQLTAPSLIRRNSINLGKIGSFKKSSNRRPKHSTNFPTKSFETRMEEKTSEYKKSENGKDQWSVSESKMDNIEKCQSDFKTGVLDGETRELNNNQVFKRRWSFHTPASNAISCGLSQTYQTPTISSITRSLDGPLQIPEYFRKHESAEKENQIDESKKGSPQTDLNSISGKLSLSTKSLIMAQSSSTNSIPLEVSKELAEIDTSKPKYAGILKNPGRRKTSSNHRVEFLENLEEREIPGRYT